MKLLTIVGARPQFVKAAMLSKECADRDGIEEVLVHTGQHYDASMSDIFFEELGIPPCQLHLGVGSGAHGVQTARMLTAIEEGIREIRPEIVVVFGDTNSTIAGALAAAKCGVPVAHVESGIRSFNRTMPEEVNRVLTDHASQFLFCPSDKAVANLLHEGIGGEAAEGDQRTEDKLSVELRPVVRNVGDIMYDVSLAFQESGKELPEQARRGVEKMGRYIAVTIHRPENTDRRERLESVVRALDEIGEENAVVWPVHPRTRNAMEQAGIRAESDNVFLIEPVSYLEMVTLMRGCSLVVTDSGGLQKEAYFHRKRCLTLRRETEWPELVKMGVNRVVEPVSKAVVVDAVANALGQGLVVGDNPYGAGNSAEMIVDEFCRWM